MSADYQAYRDLMRQIADVKYAAGVLQWDQEVYMPPGGADARARQIATLSGLHHEKFIAPELGSLLEKLSASGSLTAVEKANVKESKRQYAEQLKYPTSFVITLNETVSTAYQAWQQARKKNDFSVFEPLLVKMVDLKKQECDLLGYEGHPYNALLNLFEPGSTTQKLELLFKQVRSNLVPMAHRIDKAQPPDTSFLRLFYAKDKQWDFSLHLLKYLGYDMNRGRQDLSSHPFTTNFSPGDVRITTRVNEYDFCEMAWSTIHECGHALYEQGLPESDYGLPSGEYLSLAIHESQSRIFENNIGRSLPFWEFHYPYLQQAFPENLKNVPLKDFYRAINRVNPSLVRTQADEITYHLHIAIRFEIECGLLSGRYEAKDLPAIWNELYHSYLGVVVPDDASGVLQDVHWSHGAFGYFPTYSQGSIYAAQFYDAAARDIAGLEEQLRIGNCRPLLDWIREKIHVRGRTLAPDELCKAVTGHSIDFSIFMKYIEKKYEPLYDL